MIIELQHNFMPVKGLPLHAYAMICFISFLSIVIEVILRFSPI